MQKLLLEIFKKHMEWETDVLTLPASKKQKARGFAVLVLEEWAQGAHLEAVRTALAKEKNKKLAAQLQALSEELEQAETGQEQQGRFQRAEEQLSDYEITQPIEQLNRPVYRVTEEEISAQKIIRFYGRELNCLSLSGKLLSMGWVRVSLQTVMHINASAWNYGNLRMTYLHP